MLIVGVSSRAVVVLVGQVERDRVAWVMVVVIMVMVVIVMMIVVAVGIQVWARVETL
jgi:hypothetical protein